MRKLIIFALLLLLVTFAAACARHSNESSDDDDTLADDDTGQADDTAGADDTADDASDDTADDDTWTSPTAWDDFLAAGEQVRLANFSTAMVYYDHCVEKLSDDNSANDGPVEDMTLERAEYGYASMLVTLPMRIIESLFSGLMTSRELVAMMESAVSDIGFDPQNLPTSLLTVYLREIILPDLELAITRIDHARKRTDFSYRMPPIRMVLFDHAIQIPAHGADGTGVHGLPEAHMLAALYHLVYSSSLFITAYNLDTDASRIDDLINIFLSGDFTQLFQIIQQYPNFLTLHDDDQIDGRAYMAHSHDEYIKSILAVFDRSVDPLRLPDDFYDAWQEETGDLSDDIIGHSAGGGLSLNIAIDGNEVGSSGIVAILNLLIALVPESVVDGLTQSLLGTYPPEQNRTNGKDDDFALGTSTAITDTTLTDASAHFTPGALVGDVLNPNTAQYGDHGTNLTPTILANTATTITVDGGLSLVAQPGNEYTVGDGFPDDGPADISLLFRLLIPDFIPPGSNVGIYISKIYDEPVDLRDLIPLWDENAGDPSFLNFVVDSTESFVDVNGNGRYDLGIDTFTDQPHAFGDLSFPPDGFFEPFYFFFPDGTFGGLLQFGGDLSDQNPSDVLNRIVSGLFMLGGLQ